ncbi:AlpA family phage regulatory protein [Ralstonia insidiosa]|uniref:AlpA family phage regulatory protein n=1 Tax=Ralstonia insidiosa TaxID=190721 RepID=UPI001ABFE1C2|nr:AlpA family phage regulatory protein [Ralstonia insidiosa]
MQLRVELPSGPLIEFLSLCKAIAQAVRPVRENGLKGIECIVGKVATHEILMDRSTGSLAWTLGTGFQGVLVSEDGRTHDQLIGGKYNGAEAVEPVLPLGEQVVELSLPYLLDDSDRRALETALPQLPPLSYPMSVEAAAAFLEAYRNLPGRPAWEPVLMSALDIERRRDEQARVMERHQRELQEAFAAGRFVALDHRHVRMQALMAGSYLLREDAIAYLKERGLTVDEGGVPHDIAPTARTAEPELVAPAVMPLKLDTVGQSAPIEAVPPASDAHESAEGAVPAVADPPMLRMGVPTKKVGKVVRLPQVELMTGLSRSSIYNRMDERSPQYDPTFPRQFPLGLTVGSAVGWDAAEIEAWVVAQAERPTQPRVRGRPRRSP